MTQSNGHVEPIAGAPPQEPPHWRPEPSPGPDLPARRRPDAPVLVQAAATVSIVLGVLLTVVAVSTVTTAIGVLPALLKVLLPATMVLGGIAALHGRRGALTTGAVFLLLTGIVLVVALLGFDNFDSTAAPIEAAVRLVSAVLIIVFSRVPASAAFFDAAEELRYGRKDADFFR